MKTARKASLLLAFCLLLSLVFCGAAAAAEIPKGYKVTEVAEMSSDLEYDISSDGAVYTRGVDESGEYYVYRIYSYLGDPILEEDLYDIEGIGDGFFTVRAATEEVNSLGLVSADGEMLIPCEAAIINEAYHTDTPDDPVRYLEVVYATGETEDEDEAFFYTTSAMFSLTPTEDDLLYTGYAKIYDLETRQFVGDITVDNPDRFAVNACGDYVAVEDLDGNVTVYDADGNETMKVKDHYVPLYGSNFLVVSDSGYFVYDAANGDKLSFFEGSVDGCGDYIFVRDKDSGTYQVMDPEGDPVLDMEFDSISKVQGGILSAMLDEDTRVLVNLDTGKVIAERDSDGYFTYINHGYWYYENEDEDIVVVAPDGSEYVTGSYYSNFTVKQETDDGYAYFVLSDGDFTLELDNTGGTLGEGMLSYREDGEYGVYDLFSGDVLIPFEYKSVGYGSGYLYAFDGDTYTIYQAELQFR